MMSIGSPGIPAAATVTGSATATASSLHSKNIMNRQTIEELLLKQK
jgi:hypothetical protein